MIKKTFIFILTVILAIMAAIWFTDPDRRNHRRH
jgi:hypothetical protein